MPRREIQPVDLQERAAQAKIDGNSQENANLGRFQDTSPEASLASWESFKSEVPDFVKGLPSMVGGLSVDLMALMVSGGYASYNYLVHGTDFNFVTPDFADVPGSSTSIGQALGADTDSFGFNLAAFVNPEGPVFGAVKVLKAYLSATKAAAAVSKLTIGGAIAAKNIPGELARRRVAIKAAAAGKSREEIFHHTGWWKEDDVWRFYISDAGSRVNMKQIERAGENVLAKVGDEFSVEGLLGDFLHHPEYFRAFPEYKDMTTVMWAKRIEDVDGIKTYEIFQQKAFDKNLLGAVSGENPDKIMDIFNAGKGKFDNARSVILHEANHLPQGPEGFDLGANAKMFQKRIENAAKSSLEMEIIGDLMTGALIKGMDDVELLTYLSRINRRHKTTKFKVLKDQVNELMEIGSTQSELKSAVGKIQTMHKQNIRDVRIMMEELGDIGEGLTQAEMVRMVVAMTPDDITTLAYRRYRNQGGEIASRLVEYLDNKSIEQIRKGGIPDNQSATAAKVMAKGDAVVGDAARDPQKLIAEILGTDADGIMRDLPDFAPRGLTKVKLP